MDKKDNSIIEESKINEKSNIEILSNLKQKAMILRNQEKFKL